MNVDWDLLWKFAVALLAIVNPVEKIPLRVAASEGGSTPFKLLLNLVSRIFGMILIAIAVQFMVGGLLEVFPGWGAPLGD